MTRMIRTHLRQVVTVAAVMGLAVAPAAHAALAVQHDSTVVSETAGNGNGVPEPGDTLALTENVMSVDPDQTFTSVSGTLATTFADAAVGSASSAYADLVFALPAGNATPYSVSLSKTMECGAAVPFTLSMQTSAGPTDVPFSLPTGSAGPFTSYDSTDVPRAIPDGDFFGLWSDLTIGGTGARVKGVRVRIGQITHTFDGDLTLYLVSPDGQSVKLVGGKGGSGQDFVDTVFDDSAAAAIRSTTAAPFTGTFRPAQPLSALDGAPLNGSWKLRVVDGSSGAIGTVDAWGLDISAAVCEPQPPPPPPPATGQHDCGQHNGQGNAFGLINQPSVADRTCPDKAEPARGGKKR
jgi:subtilisin-like proprotein convertase family protein